ncbi:MAG: hypothetical protein ACREBU_08320 [Nitrososphaera sp.]
MSEDAGRTKYQQIVNDLRSDLDNIGKAYAVLEGKIQGNTTSNGQLASDIAYWIDDSFIERVQAFDHKFKRITKDLVGRSAHNFSSQINSLIDTAHNLAFARELNNFETYRERLPYYINELIREANRDFLRMRSKLIESGWNIGNVVPVAYVSIERKKYVTAREELAKAKTAAPEDVVIHLRGAIDLSIKEKFGFKKIQPMTTFLQKADELNFPLPSYDLIYTYYDVGSGRFHSGKIHTPFEVNEAVRTVSNFIDELDLIQVTKEQVEAFAKNCDAVKL